MEPQPVTKISALVPIESRPAGLAQTTVEALAAIPEEEVWLAKQKSARTRRAYKLDVQHFMRTVGVLTREQLRQVDHRAVIAWEAHMREREHAEASTIRRRLSALSSLFKHLVEHGEVERNPVREVRRPDINRDEGSTAAFSKAQARKILDHPDAETVEGLRDRAILSVGFQVGLRRAEIASLSVGDLHENAGYASLRVLGKGNRKRSLAIHQQTAQRIRDYLALAGHAGDFDGPLFRPLHNNGHAQDGRRHMDPDAIDRVVRKHAAAVGLTRGYSAHSMRATFITTALKNGADIIEVQHAAGHRDISTTRLYDRRRYDPEKAASFFANY